MATKATLMVNPATGAISAPITAATFRDANGLEIGADIQAWSADLDAVVANTLWTGSNVAFAGDLNAVGSSTLGGDLFVSGIFAAEQNASFNQGLTIGTTLAVTTSITIGGVAVPTISSTSTFTNKTINLSSNTLVATSAQLAAAVTDETGSGALVFATNPTLSSPVLGVATGTSFNGLTITATSGGTLTIGNGGTLSVAGSKTATFSNTLTFTGTDSSSVAFGTGGTVLYSGGALGTPSSGTLTNATGLPVSTGISGLGTNVATKLQRSNLGHGVVLKTSDTARELTTSPSADPALTFAVEANTNYRFRFNVYVMVQSATPNFKWGVIGPSSPTAFGVLHQVWSNNLLVSSGGLETSTSYNTGYAVTIGDPAIYYVLMSEGYIRNGANAGSVTLSWSQQTSSADDTTVKAGSHVIWEVAD